MSKTTLSLILALVIIIAWRNDKRLLNQSLDILKPSSFHQHESRGQGVMDVPSSSSSSSVLFQRQQDHTLTDNNVANNNATTDSAADANSNSTTDLQPTPLIDNRKPTKMFLRKDFFVFLHMGKAGGGTIATRLRQVWNLQTLQCHPW